MLITLVSFIIVLGVVVFIHELGHFLAAKAVGARVEIFSLGFGKLVGKRHGDTEYRLGWIPLGGYVKIAGMVDESLDEGGITGAPDEFMSKSAPAKIFMISAGVLMNILLGFLIYWFIVLVQGEAKFDQAATVGSLAADYPAQDAGILEGDRILSIEGATIETWDDLIHAIHGNPGDTLAVTWLHGSDSLSALIPARSERILDGSEFREVGMIGIGQSYEMVPVGIGRAAVIGARLTYGYLELSARSLSMMITGRASIRELTGPVGIVVLSGATARAGWLIFLGFIGLISVSIGFLNILPIPALDGGHLVYIIIEAAIRRPISTRVKLILQQVGIAALLLLVVIVSYHDIIRFFIH